MEALGTCPLCGAARRRPVGAVKERILGTGETFTVVRCEGCGLFRTDPRPTRAERGRYYPEHYTAYQATDGDGEPWLGAGVKGIVRRWTLTAQYGYPLDDLGGALRWLIPWLTRPLRGRYVEFPPFRPGGRLVEVGCATGHRLALLRRLGWEVQGVEISEQACRSAKARYGLEVFCGELEEAGLPAASADAVVMSHVVEHLHDPVATLREVKRILRPAGVVVMETPNARSLARWIFGDCWYEWEVPRHLFLFDARTLGLACERAGLRVERVAYSSFTFDWNRSLAYWCRDRGREGLAAWWGEPRRVTELVLRPWGKMLAWACLAGRMIVVARAG